MILIGGDIDALFQRELESTPCREGFIETEIKYPFHNSKRTVSTFHCPFIYEMLDIANAAMPEYDEDGALIEPPTLNCIEYVV